MTDYAGKPRLYIDSTILIDTFEGNTSYTADLQHPFLGSRGVPILAATSELLLAELLGKISVRGWVLQKRFYLDLLAFKKIFDLRPVTWSVLIGTGDLRKAAASLGRATKLPDAIHAVTALNGGCRYLFTRNKRFFVTKPFGMLAPDETGFATIRQALDA